MSRPQSIFIPFLFALITFPSFVFLHECGHFAAGRLLGSRVEMHYSEVRSTTSGGASAPRNEKLITAAGPAVNLILGGAGLCWLWILRRERRESPASALDWLATCVAWSAGRGLRGLSLFSNPQLLDEAIVSQALGWPAWMVPGLLLLIAIIALVAVIRLHPRGARLGPFAALGVGGLLGVELWMRVIGPRLLP